MDQARLSSLVNRQVEDNVQTLYSVLLCTLYYSVLCTTVYYRVQCITTGRTSWCWTQSYARTQLLATEAGTSGRVVENTPSLSPNTLLSKRMDKGAGTEVQDKMLVRHASFSPNRPLGRFGLVVAMSVPLGVVPFLCNSPRGAKEVPGEHQYPEKMYINME